MQKHIPQNTVYVSDTAAQILSGSTFLGQERVVFVLKLQKDVYPTPGADLDPVGDYFLQSSLPDLLGDIVLNPDVTIEGPILTLKNEMVQWGGLNDLRSNLHNNDYSDIMHIEAFEAVPGIFSVTAKIRGESNVECVRRLSTPTLEALSIAVITDFLVIKTNDMEDI